MTTEEVKALAEQNGVTITTARCTGTTYTRADARVVERIGIAYHDDPERAVVLALEELAWTIAEHYPVSQLLESPMGWAFDVFTEDGRFPVAAAMRPSDAPGGEGS